MRFGLQFLWNKWFIVENAFRSKIKMSCARVGTKNNEKWKFSESCAMEERCLSEVQVRSKLLFTDMQWPPTHCPKLQRHGNIKDVLISPFFWVSESQCFEEKDVGKGILFLLYPLIFLNKPVSVGKGSWCTVCIMYMVTTNIF